MRNNSKRIFDNNSSDNRNGADLNEDGLMTYNNLIPDNHVGFKQNEFELFTCASHHFLPGVFFNGADALAGVLDGEAASATECCIRCVATDVCTHWTWLVEGACQLKSGDLRQALTPLGSAPVSGEVESEARARWIANAADLSAADNAELDFPIY